MGYKLTASCELSVGTRLWVGGMDEGMERQMGKIMDNDIMDESFKPLHQDLEL